MRVEGSVRMGSEDCRRQGNQGARVSKQEYLYAFSTWEDTDVWAENSNGAPSPYM